jgi:hypothetical protein
MKDLVASLCAIRGWWNLQEVNSTGGKLGYGGHALEGDIRTLVSSSSFLLVPTMRCSKYDVLPCYRPSKAVGPTDRGLKPPKLKPK